MSAPAGPNPPTADEIDRRFGSAPVVLTRPVILASLKVLTTARRFGWDAEGVERLERLETPVVIAANHHSHTDTAAILGSLPKPMRSRTAVAAALDVFGTGSKGRSLRNECLQLIVASGFHAFAFDRHGPPLRSLRTSVELIRRGWNLLLYPEGTRSRSGQLGRFKSGVGVLARFSGRPVVPVHVDGGQTVHPQGRFLPGRGRFSVRFGEPLHYRAGETPAAFTHRLREQVIALRGDVPEPVAAAEPAPSSNAGARLGSPAAGS